MRTHLHKESLARQQQEQQLKSLVGVAAASLANQQPNGAAGTSNQLDHHSIPHIALNYPQLNQKLMAHNQVAAAVAAQFSSSNPLYAANMSQRQKDCGLSPVSALINQQLAAAVKSGQFRATNQRGRRAANQQSQPSQHFEPTSLGAGQLQNEPASDLESVPIPPDDHNRSPRSLAHQFQASNDVTLNSARLHHHHQQPHQQPQQQYQSSGSVSPLDPHQQTLMMGALQGDQLGLESVKAVMLAAAAAAAAAAVQSQQQGLIGCSSQSQSGREPKSLIAQQDALNRCDSVSVSESEWLQTRGKRRKQVNPRSTRHQASQPSLSAGSHQDDQSEHGSDLEPEEEAERSQSEKRAARSGSDAESLDENDSLDLMSLSSDMRHPSCSSSDLLKGESRSKLSYANDSNNNNTDHNASSGTSRLKELGQSDPGARELAECSLGELEMEDDYDVEEDAEGENEDEEVETMTIDEESKADLLDQDADDDDDATTNDFSGSDNNNNNQNGLSKYTNDDSASMMNPFGSSGRPKRQTNDLNSSDLEQSARQNQHRRETRGSSLGAGSPLTTIDGEIIEDISQSYVKTANPHANRKGGKRNRHCYQCKLCTYSSVDRCTLVRHLRIHSGERPYICGLCRYAFTTKANCERHVRKRHKKQYNSLGGSGGVKGSNGGGRSLIITDHSNHQTIPNEVNPEAAETITQTLRRIQEKQQQDAIESATKRLDEDRLMSNSDEMQSRSMDEIHKTAISTTANYRISGKRKHRSAHSSLRDRSSIIPYPRRRIIDKDDTFGDNQSHSTVQLNPTGLSHKKLESMQQKTDTSRHNLFNSHLNLTSPMTPELMPSTNGLFVNLMAQLQQVTSSANQDFQQNVSSTSSTSTAINALRQPQPALSPDGTQSGPSLVSANLLANMLASSKASMDGGRQALAAERISSLLSPKNISEQIVRNLNQHNPFSAFIRRNPYDPFNPIDLAVQALDLSCKFQSSK